MPVSGAVTLLPPPADAQNWREYADFLEQDNHFTFYNVWRAASDEQPISISTCLRIYENQLDNISLLFAINQTGIPNTWEVSLSDNLGKISIHRIKFGNGSYLIQTYGNLPKDYDGTPTLNIYPDPAAKIPLGAFAGVYLQCFGRHPYQKDEEIVLQDVLLGSENVLFHTSN